MPESSNQLTPDLEEAVKTALTGWPMAGQPLISSDQKDLLQVGKPIEIMQIDLQNRAIFSSLTQPEWQIPVYAKAGDSFKQATDALVIARGAAEAVKLADVGRSPTAGFVTTTLKMLQNYPRARAHLIMANYNSPGRAVRIINQAGASADTEEFFLAYEEGNAESLPYEDILDVMTALEERIPNISGFIERLREKALHCLTMYRGGVIL